MKEFNKFWRFLPSSPKVLVGDPLLSKKEMTDSRTLRAGRHSGMTTKTTATTTTDSVTLRAAKPYGMTSDWGCRTVNHFCTVSGFTLIELLVVVLIIGILAAVAVPQYEKAVEKSRTAEAITGLTAIGHAQEVYHLATGSYADDWSDLDVSIQAGKNFTFAGKSRSEGLYPGSVAQASRNPYYTRYTLLYMPEEQKIVCFAHQTNQRQYCTAAGLEFAANSY